MSLLDDVIVNVAAAVETMNQVAVDVVDRSKARVSSAELKSKISSQFEKLGRYVYDTNATGNTDCSIVNQYVSEITALINELKVLQDSLNEVSDKRQCPKCGCCNSFDSLFCKKCGASLDFRNDYTVNSAPVPQPVNCADCAEQTTDEQSEQTKTEEEKTPEE